MDDCRLVEAEPRCYIPGYPKVYVLVNSAWDKAVMIRVRPEHVREARGKRRRRLNR